MTDGVQRGGVRANDAVARANEAASNVQAVAAATEELAGGSVGALRDATGGIAAQGEALQRELAQVVRQLKAA